jgi:hypothetical protein
MGIRPGRLQSHSIKLDGVLRFEASVLLTHYRDRRLVSINKELQLAWVNPRVEPSSHQFGLGNAIPTGLPDIEFDSGGG